MYWNKKKKKSKDWKAELNVEMENEESKREKKIIMIGRKQKIHHE